MRRYFAYVIAIAAIVTSGGALAQDAREIMEIARQKQLERWEGVDAYVVEQSIMGQSSATWHLRAEVQQPDGSTGTVFLPMASAQLQGDPCGFGQMTDEDLATFAAASGATGDAMATEIEDGLEAAGLPRGMLAATGSDPLNTMDPRVMMGGYSDFLTAAVHAQRELDAYEPDRDAEAQLNDMNRFMDTAKLKGTEIVDGRDAYHLRATDLDMVERSDDGEEYRIDSMSVYVDAAEYVPLRMRVEGTMISASESQEMVIEILQTDYRQVPGSKLYESYRRVMKMSGMMTPEQQAEMAEAQAQMADFEKQLASMPESQRQMMESMMGPQLEMMRNMANGGGFQTEVITNNIRVNPPLQDASGQACPGSKARPAPVGAAPANHTQPVPGVMAQASAPANE